MPQQKSKKILIYFLLFLIIGTFNNKNLEDLSFLKIKKISIIGLGEKINFQLINSLNFLKGNNLFFLNKNKLIEKIDSNSLVEKYSVFKIYPSTLDIRIYKTIFLAQLKKNDDSFLLGSNGKFTKTIDTEIDLPFIFGDFKVINFFELKNAIDQTNLNFNEIRNLYFFKSGRWDIETNDGILIKLPKDGLKKSLELITSFLAQNNEQKINKVDLRQHNQIIINGR